MLYCTQGCPNYCVQLVLQEKCPKCCSFMMVPSHSQVCTPLRPSQNLDRVCCHTHQSVLILHCQIFTCLVFQKMVCKDTITGMVRHCRLLHMCGCRGRREAFTRHWYACFCCKVEEVCWQRWRLHWKYQCFQEICNKVLWNFHMSNL